MKNIFITLIFIQRVNVLCIAQSFTYHSDSPFGITPVKADSTRSAAKVMFYDFDLDGDLDLFMSGLDYFDDELLGWENIHHFLEMQENVGDRFNPVFAERTNAFDDFPFTVGLFFPAIGDVTGDGLADFVMNGEIDFIGNTTMLYAPNTGTKQNPEFEPIRFGSMGLDDFVPESFFDPALVDLDSDGDLDILMSGLDPAFAEEDGPDIPRFYYAKNFGTSKSPDFKGWYSDPYGLTPDTLAELTTVGDIDNDGDMDVVGTAMLIPADSIHSIKVHLNAPTPEGKPGFNGFLQSPFGLPVSQGEEQFLFPTLVDLDNDGDLDLFVFKLTVNGTILEYYENALCTVTTQETELTICDGDVIDINGQLLTEEGTYDFYTEGPDGCTQHNLIHLFVEDVYATAIEEVICEGESIDIGGNVFTEPGHYDVPLFSVSGCDSLVALDLAVIVIDNMVIVQETVLIANPFGMTYQWIDCDTGEDIPGATNQSYEVLVTGNYAVIITDGSGCSTESECITVVITSIQELELSGKLTLYPNPTHGMISLLNTSQYPITALSLTNVSGQVVDEFNISRSLTLDITQLGQGVYFAKIEINGVVILKKVIVI